MKNKKLVSLFFMSFQSLTYGKSNVFTVGKFDQITLANKKVSHPDTQQNIKTVQGTSQTHGLTWPRYFSRASIWELKDVFSKTSLSFKDMSNKPEGCNYFNATGDRYCICTTVIFLYLFMFTSAISISSIPCIDLVPPTLHPPPPPTHKYIAWALYRVRHTLFLQMEKALIKSLGTRTDVLFTFACSTYSNHR